MENYFILQLGGIGLCVLGLIGLSLTANLFGTALTLQEKRQMGGDWASKGTVHRLPLRWETLISTALLLFGLFVLTYTRFEPCAFLAYWVPDLLPQARVLFACK